MAGEVRTLVDGPLPVTDPFVIPDLLSLEWKAKIDSLVNGLPVFGQQIDKGKAGKRSATSQDYTFSITPPPGQPLDGVVTWYAEALGPDGISTEGVTTTFSQDDTTKVTVTFEDSVIGNVVVYGSYVSTNGTLVVGYPALVASITSPGAVLTGIDTGETDITLNPGDKVFLHIFGEYSDGSRIPQFLSIHDTVGLTSSNPTVVSADSAGISLDALAPRRAVVSTTLGDFTTQTNVTVDAIPPPPTPTTTPTPTATPTPSGTPTPTPTPSNTPQPGSAVNISTRLAVGTGDDVLIGGFIITGNVPKKVILRAIGPSLNVGGVPLAGTLQDTVLELHGTTGLIQSNDNWQSDQKTAIEKSGVPPADPKESAIVATLESGNYTAIVHGKGSATGIALVEIYDLDTNSASQLANVSTRGKVETGDNAMIGGVIVGGDTPADVLVRAIGPSLTGKGVAGALQDTTLELHSSNGDLLDSNDDWQSDQKQKIIDTTVPPTDPHESAILRTLAPGAYTAVVRGKNDSTGVALVEGYIITP